MDVVAPDLDSQVVEDSPGNRGVDVKRENAARASTSVFGAANNVSSDSISTKLCLNETPDAPTVNQAARPMSALPASVACALQRTSLSEADLASFEPSEVGNCRVERRAPIFEGMICRSQTWEASVLSVSIYFSTTLTF